MVDPPSQLQERKGAQGLSAVRIGRRVGASLFWVIVVFVAASATLSIVTQVFPSLARRPLKTEAHERCSERIPALRGELLERLRQMPGDGERGVKVWFAQWDERFHALGTHCGELEQTRVELQRLRDSIQALQQRFERREAPRLERIQRAIDDYAASHRERESS